MARARVARARYSLLGLALTDAVPPVRRHVGGLAEGEPDLASGEARLDRLVGSDATEGIEYYIASEHSAIRPELVGDRNPEFTQTHESTVPAAEAPRWHPPAGRTARRRRSPRRALRDGDWVRSSRPEIC